MNVLNSMMVVLIERLILWREDLGLKELIFTSGCSTVNQSTSDIHSAWAACIYRTTGRYGYHSANRWSYNYNTSLPSSSPASSLRSTASSCEFYFEKKIVVSNKNQCTCIEVFLFVLWHSHFQVCSVKTH